jgi:diadenosine tetraphosphatase ApaH/serine/threonine PP2A family protein phosphatase
VNIGAVGQPRDGDTRATYGIFDTETLKITIHKKTYDILATQKLMCNKGLPSFLIERLSLGI